MSTDASDRLGLTADYDHDFYAWTAEQAALLRAGQWDRADMAHVAEEIEDLGKSDRRELETRIRTILEHLMKLQASPATAPRAGWRETVRNARRRVELIVEDSPSLRRMIPDMIARQIEKARQDVAGNLADRGEDTSALVGCTYTEDQVIGDWLP